MAGYTQNDLRTKKVFDPFSKSPFRLSRSKIDLFIKCPRCFYLDRRLGISQPSGPPFTLNTAVDKLLKKEFDMHRKKGTAHPIMEKYGLKAIPLSHQDLDIWRENFKGIQFFHKETNLIITGAIDDVWVDKDSNLIIVDYKSTAKEGKITLEDGWKEAYKRQIEIYQWLFRKNGFSVSDISYFLYCNGNTSQVFFEGKLEFDVILIPYKGNDSWVEDTLKKAKRCLLSESIPSRNSICEFCNYVEAVENIESLAVNPKNSNKKVSEQIKQAQLFD